MILDLYYKVLYVKCASAMSNRLAIVDDSDWQLKDLDTAWQFLP